MARLREYLRNLQEDYKPQPPTPIDEDTEQKAEAFDYLLTGVDESADESQNK